jgi:hypothetical protein
MASFKILSLLSCLFEELSVVKPITSRPTSSERYLFCHHFRSLSPQQRSQLQDLLWEFQLTSPQASCSSPPLGSVIRKRLNSFHHYIRDMNDALLLVQVWALSLSLVSRPFSVNSSMLSFSSSRICCKSWTVCGKKRSTKLISKRCDH